MSDTRRYTQPGYNPETVQGKPIHSKKHQGRDRPSRGKSLRFSRWGPLPQAKAARKMERRDARQAREEAAEGALDLRTLRQILGKTQIEVAAQTAHTQSQLSRIERRRDHRLSTLRGYVEALGGELQVVAVFSDKTVRLRGV